MKATELDFTSLPEFKLQKLLLEQLGFNVVEIFHSIWRKIQSFDEKTEYLRWGFSDLDNVTSARSWWIFSHSIRHAFDAVIVGTKETQSARTQWQDNPLNLSQAQKGPTSKKQAASYLSHVLKKRRECVMQPQQSIIGSTKDPRDVVSPRLIRQIRQFNVRQRIQGQIRNRKKRREEMRKSANLWNIFLIF